MKETVAANDLKKMQISQGPVPSSGVTRSKNGTDLINVERYGLLANTRPKSSQIGGGGMTAQQRSKMLALQRNNMKSTRADSTAFIQARNSMIRSTNQLSSTGASLRSPLDPATESNNGSALPRKRRDQRLGGGSNGSNPRKYAISYNQAAKSRAQRAMGPGQSSFVAEAPSQYADQTETRIRAANIRPCNNIVARSHSRKTVEDEHGSRFGNPSIVAP